MSAPRPSDLLFYVGGYAWNRRYGVPFRRVAPAYAGGELATPTTTRADSRTQRCSDGLIRSAGANVPRLDYRDIDGDGILEPCILAERGTTQIVENSGCETDVVAWLGANGGETLVRDSTQAIQGSWSCKVTTQNVGGSGCFWRKRDGTRFAAAASTPYSISVWIYAPAASVGKTMTLAVQWYNAVPAVISTSTSTTFTLVAGWQWLTFTALSAVGTVTAVPLFINTGAIGIFDFWGDLPQFEAVAFPTSGVITSADVGGKVVGADALSWPIAFSPPAVGEEHTYYFRGDASWARTGALADINYFPGVFGIGRGVRAADSKTSLGLYRNTTTGDAILRLAGGDNIAYTAQVALPASGPVEFLAQLRASGLLHLVYLENPAGVNASSAGAPVAGTPWRQQALELNVRDDSNAQNGATWCHKWIGARGRFSMADFRAIP